MQTIIVGGSGFIGQAVQEHVVNQGLQESFVFTYNNNPEKIREDLQKIKINLMNSNIQIDSFPTAIYVAGNADHSLARKDPLLDLELNVKVFLNFMKRFRGSLVLLSSQAIYYGLDGEIYENVNHVSRMPYGLSKQMVESYAKYFLEIKHLSKLWICRLMYAYGEGEKERRIIPTCARSSYTNEKVGIFGGGRSFLNPLPSQFVAKILVNASEDLQLKDDEFLEITNLNHPEKITVADVVTYLNSLKPFNYEIKDSGEEWPVRFWGNTKNLYSYLKEWNMDFPDVWDSLKEYFLDLIRNKVK